jgi:hypothetical protein
MYVETTETRSRNRWCCGKERRFQYSECVSVALWPIHT